MLILDNGTYAERSATTPSTATGVVRIGVCSLQPPRSDRLVVGLTRERIKRRPVLSELINEYERAA